MAVSRSFPVSVTETAVLAFVVTAWLLAVGESFTSVTVMFTVEVFES